MAKCETKYQTAWQKAEQKAANAGGACPTTGDQAAVQGVAGAFTDNVAAHLGGAALDDCPTSLDTCESDLSTSESNLSTCESNLSACLGGPLAPLLRTGQTTAYGTGSDGDLQKGVARAYTDNGDGTITDNTTGLMWEKKDRSGGIHDVDNSYTWSGTSYGGTNIMDGTITTTFLAALNAGDGFAGHTDWRIPNQNELLSLVNYENVNPSVDAAFNTSCAASCTLLTCSCTKSSYYWSSTTYRGFPDFAWGAGFYDGYDYANVKSDYSYVRAVRGGS
jgi:hypothetical protein